MSVDEALEFYRDLSAATDFPRFRVGELHWFPLFRSAGTDFYGICGTTAAIQVS